MGDTKLLLNRLIKSDFINLHIWATSMFQNGMTMLKNKYTDDCRAFSVLYNIELKKYPKFKYGVWVCLTNKTYMFKLFSISVLSVILMGKGFINVYPEMVPLVKRVYTISLWVWIIGIPINGINSFWNNKDIVINNFNKKITHPEIRDITVNKLIKYSMTRVLLTYGLSILITTFVSLVLMVKIVEYLFSSF